jgi:hypothetical protein
MRIEISWQRLTAAHQQPEKASRRVIVDGDDNGVKRFFFPLRRSVAGMATNDR